MRRVPISIRFAMTVVGLLVCLAGSSTPGKAQVVPGLPATGGMHVFAQSWNIDEGDTSTKIQQIVTPVGVLIPIQDGIQLKLASSLVALSKEENGQTESVSGLSDVKLEGNVGLLDRRIQLGVAVNLPTGGADLSSQEQDVVFGFVSPDLSVRANRLGEGFNIGASAAIAHPINQTTTAGLGLAFVHKGPYDTSLPGSRAAFRLDPGYEARATAGLDVAANVYRIHIGATLTVFGSEKVEETEVYQLGPQLAIDLSGSRPFLMERGHVYAGVTAIGRGPNAVRSDGTLVDEALSSNNDQLLVEIGSSYVIAPPWSIAGRVLGRYVAPNDNDVGDARVLEGGLSGSYAVNERLAVSAGGRVIFGEGTGFSGLSRSIFGLEGVIRASVRF